MEVRRQLLAALDGGQAHPAFHDVIDGFPAERCGERPPGFAHSAWELLEHLRIAQRDIIEFCISGDYPKLKWPADYWPKGEPSARDWQASVGEIEKDMAQFRTLIEDASGDLYAPFAWGEGQNLLREALVIIDHNAWHLGQLLQLRRALE
jgi:hypothetical protein